MTTLPETSSPTDAGHHAGPPSNRTDDLVTLGPVATLMGQAFVAGALVHAFGVLYDRLPPLFTLVLMAPAVVCTVLAPPDLRRHGRFSVSFMLLLVWVAASWTWSVHPGQTWFGLWASLPLVAGMMAITALLPTTALYSSVRASIRVTLLLVVVSLSTSSAARISGDAEFIVEGWRGTFPDKNSLALYLVFALAATLTVDRGPSRVLTSAAVLGLLVGSQSATGLSAAALVVVLWLWLSLLRRHGTRQSALFVLSSIGLGLSAFAALLANLTGILEVYGKDASLTGRTDIWDAVARAIEQRPLTGYGLSALLNPGAPSTATLALWREIGFDAAHAHNGVLDLLGQLGVIGLVLYTYVVWTTLGAAVTRLRQTSGPATFALVMLSAQLMMSVAENVFLGAWLVVLVILQAPLLRADGG